jgi:hypothetical protein
MTRKSSPGGNEGIQANVVKADVLAVGRGARAVKTVLASSDQKELLAAVAKLNQHLQSLAIDKAQLQELSKHTEQIREAVSKPQVDSTEVQGAAAKFVQRLKEVGVAVKEMAGFVAPLRTIGGLLHISLTTLGLL